MDTNRGAEWHKDKVQPVILSLRRQGRTQHDSPHDPLRTTIASGDGAGPHRKHQGRMGRCVYVPGAEGGSITAIAGRVATKPDEPNYEGATAATNTQVS